MTKGSHTMQVFVFDSTGDAYDSSQCLDQIKDGDLLIVPSEKVAGFLVQAWPCAVTDELGVFHALAEDLSWDEFEGGQYAASAKLAAEIAANGFAVENPTAINYELEG
jgi:hypothetical protein